MTRDLLATVLDRLPSPADKQRLQVVAEGSGVPIHTLLKIVKRVTKNPRIRTVQDLHNFLELERAA